MRRKYVYDPATGEMVEVTITGTQSRQHFIQADIEPFISPADGTIIKSRKHMRKYMKANNLVHFDECKDTSNTRISEREKFYQGADRKSVEQRRQSLSDSFEHNRNLARARSRHG